MKKLKYLFKLFYFLLTDYRRFSYILVNQSIEEDSKRKVMANGEFADGLPQIGLTTLIGDLDCVINPYTFMDGVAPLTDMALLQGLCKKYQVDTFLELGTWRGESMAIVSENIKKGITISFSEEEMLAKNFVPESAIKASRMFLNDLSNVEVIRANTQTYDYSRLENCVDLVFIDADHSYEGVLKDTRNALRTLRDNNSIIIWHDYGHTNEKVNWQILRAIIDGIPKEDHRYLYHVGNTLCAIFIKQDLLVQQKEPFFPREVFRVKIQKIGNRA